MILRRRDDRGSMPMAVLLTIIGVGLSGLLASTINAQISTARSTLQRSDSLDVAQSGVEVALGQIRLATKADGTGDYAKLPCGPYSGSISGATAQTYTVSIYYLTTEPPAGDLAYAQANALPCTGTYLASGKPLFAFLSSTGKVLTAQKGRIVNATYSLRTKNRENVAGGLIRLYRNGVQPDLCLAAPAAAPGAGDALSIQVCDPGSAAQRFAYETNLNLVLASTRADGSRGMCLDAVNHLDPVVFQPCTATTSARQQWSLNDRGSFEGTSDGSTLNSTCFHLTSPGTAGSAVVLHAAANDPPAVSEHDRACRTDYSDARTFTPDPDVGTGGAGQPLSATTSTQLVSQLVNFDQFGRCLDVTADDVNNTFLVIWPCKQNPNGTIQWNQVWKMKPIPLITVGTTSISGTIFTTYNGSDYCLVSPGNTTGYVRVMLCASAPVGSTTWVRRGATGVFATAYRIESTYGAPAGTTYCLSRTDPTATTPDLWQQGASKSIVRVCDASAAQKWNASPTILSSALEDVTED